MHASRRHPLPSSQDFALVDTRYVATPLVLWALAIVVATAVTLTAAPAADQAASSVDAPAVQVIAA